MATIKITRYICNRCTRSLDLTDGKDVPKGWRQVAISDAYASSGNIVDICPACEPFLMDLLQGVEGAHRPQAQKEYKNGN